MSTFNPLEFLANRKDNDNNLIWDYLEKDGKPVYREGSDGLLHKVMILRKYLPLNAYRMWFKDKYPNGRMEVEDQTPAPVFSETKGWVESPNYKIKASLYSNETSEHPMSTAYGVIPKTFKSYDSSGYDVEKEERKDNMTLAQYFAIVGAMANAGFIYNLPDELEDSEFFVANTKLEDNPAEVIPLSAVTTIAAIAKTEETKEADSSEEPEPQSNDLVNSFLKNKPKTEPEPEVNEAPVEEPQPMAEEELPAEPEAAPVEEEPKKAKTSKKTAESNDAKPEDVVFTFAEGYTPPEKFAGLVGKRIGDVDPKLIRYFANSKSAAANLTDETFSAIIDVA